MKRMFLFWLLIILMPYAVYGAHLPDGIMNYYNEEETKDFFLLRMEIAPVIPWIKFITLGKTDEKQYYMTDKVLLVIDTKLKQYRILGIWHQKREIKGEKEEAVKEKIITIDCHVDSNYLETLGSGEPKWLSFSNLSCKEEFEKFLYHLDEVYREEDYKIWDLWRRKNLHK